MIVHSWAKVGSRHQRPFGIIFLMKFKLAFFLFLTTFIFFFNLLFYFLKPARDFFYFIFSPFQKYLWRLGGKFFDFSFAILNCQKLKKENDFLISKLQKLENEISILKEKGRENEILRKALEIGLEKEYGLIFSEILNRQIFSDYFILDKGKKDGVKEGMAVINESKSVCGKVTEVYERTSKIQKIFSKNFSFIVKIPGFPQIFSAKADGMEIYIDSIPKEMEVKVGDLILTSPEGEIFPKDLLVGKIEKIEKSDLEPFQKVKILPFCQVEKLTSLFIIKEW